MQRVNVENGIADVSIIYKHKQSILKPGIFSEQPKALHNGPDTLNDDKDKEILQRVSSGTSQLNDY